MVINKESLTVAIETSTRDRDMIWKEEMITMTVVKERDSEDIDDLLY